MKTERGISGYCGQLGKHSRCAHSMGGPQELGVVLDDDTLWRCGCQCHRDPVPSVYRGPAPPAPLYEDHQLPLFDGA
jgi:hypothetical protein